MATHLCDLNIPPLQSGERIEDWERLFRAAVTSLLTQEGGQRLAISLLPAYVCRRVAERELVREVVNEAESLDEAFKTLRDNLDSPVDPTKAMQTIRNKDWEPGVFIDDYFYDLKTVTIWAKAPLRIACVVLITQLPPSMQGPINDWLTGKDEVTAAVAREFIGNVRKVLVEKNIPLDKGYRDFGQVCEIRVENETSSCDSCGKTPQLAQGSTVIQNPCHETENDSVKVIQRWERRGRSTFRGGPNRSRGGSRYRSQPLACFVCESTEHLQRACPSQYCQACRKKGHDRRDCYSKKRVYSVDTRGGSAARNDYLSEAGVMIPIKLIGKETNVMLDSGAQPSIIETDSLGKLHVNFQIRPSQVPGVSPHQSKPRDSSTWK